MTLLKETLEILEEHGKTIEDIKWVGSREVEIPLSEWQAVFAVEYYSGYGGQEIARDLLVVGKGWWLERGEYDGSEWWEFKTMPKKPKAVRSGLKVKTDSSWSSLLESNERGD